MRKTEERKEEPVPGRSPAYMPVVPLSAPQTGGTGSAAPVSSAAPEPQPSEPAAARDYSQIGNIKCPKCGCVQPSVRKTCWDCGASLKEEN